MRNKYLFWSSCLMVVVFLFFAGCNDDESNSPTKSLPSNLDYPYGVKTMTVQLDEQSTATFDFVYDNSGRAVEAGVWYENDSNHDGRADEIVSGTYTIDPTIEAQEFPDIEEMFVEPAAYEAKVSRIGPEIIAIPDVINKLPGAISEFALHRYIYSGYAFRGFAGQVPEELIETTTVEAAYAYNDAGLPTSLTITIEDMGMDIRAGGLWGEAGLPASFTNALPQAPLGAVTAANFTIDIFYDASGNRSGMKNYTELDFGNDGAIESKSVVDTVYAYDQKGNLSEMVREYLGEGLVENTTYTYDDYDRVLEKVFERKDLTAEGAVQYQATSTYEYDEQGRVTKRETMEDNDGDPSSTDDIDTHTHTYSYDGFGLVSYTYDYLSYFGGSRNEGFVFAYNDLGQLSRKQYREGDGDFIIQNFSYDAEGRLETVEQSRNAAVNDEPGAASYKEITTFAYGEDDRLNQRLFEEADNGTDINRRQSLAFTYGDDGKAAAVILQDYEWDSAAADGQGDFVEAGEEAQLLDFEFSAGIPTGFMEVPVQELPVRRVRGNHELDNFEKVTLYAQFPALNYFLTLFEESRPD